MKNNYYLILIVALFGNVNAQEVKSSVEKNNTAIVEAPTLDPDVLEKIEQMEIENLDGANDSSVVEAIPAEKDSLDQNDEELISIYDELLQNSGELKALGVTSVAQLSPEVYSKVVSELLKNITPPELIRLTRRLQEIKYKAEVEPLRKVQSLSSTFELDVDGGSTIQEIKLIPGYLTTIEFFDTAGNPWPIVDQSIGSKIFTVTRPETAPHTFRILVDQDFKQTNLSYLLDSIPTSFRFILSATDETNGKEVRPYHDRVRITVPLVSRAMKEGLSNLKVAAVPVRNSDLTMFLEISEYESVDGAIVVPVIDGSAQVWIYDGSMYVRTRYKSLMFPQSKQEATSGSGIKVYRLDDIRPLLIFSDNGQEKYVQLDDDVIIQAAMMNNQNELIEDNKSKQRGKETKEGKSGYYSAK
jgi:hypothetical protein